MKSWKYSNNYYYYYYFNFNDSKHWGSGMCIAFNLKRIFKLREMKKLRFAKCNISILRSNNWVKWPEKSLISVPFYYFLQILILKLKNLKSVYFVKFLCPEMLLKWTFQIITRFWLKHFSWFSIKFWKCCIICNKNEVKTPPDILTTQEM